MQHQPFQWHSHPPCQLCNITFWNVSQSRMVSNVLYIHELFRGSNYHYVTRKLMLIFYIWIYAATYFVSVATIAALVGQHVIRRVIALFGRASIVIFILAMTIFTSAISLGIYQLSSSLIIFAHCFFSIFWHRTLCWIIGRWCGDSKYDWEAGEQRLYGIWQPLLPILDMLNLSSKQGLAVEGYD